MKKNTLLLLVIAVGIILVYLFIGGGLKQDVTGTADDADFYADEQLAAQAGCSGSTTPTITAISATGITSGSATLVWTTNMLANSEVKYWTSPQTANSVSWQPILDASGTLNHSYQISGLSPSKTYSYRVRSSAVPSGCRKTSTTKTFATLAGSTTAPLAATNLSATVNSCNAVTLNWTASAGATGYEVYGPNSACNVNGSAGYCGTTTGTTLSLTNLTGGKNYTGSTGQYAGFTVLAYNSAGYAPSTPRLSTATPVCEANDTSAPTTTTAAPSGSWATTNISRTLTCTDNPVVGAFGCSATYWQFVASTATCPAAGATSYATGTTASTTTDGQWKLCFYSRDVVNNVENPINALSTFKLDSVAPTGSITAPAASATVSGTAVTISASASDALSGVASVAFKVDGATVATDTTSPYSASWNSTTVANGSRSITAVVTDVAGNTFTTPARTVTVSNSTTSVPATPTGLSVSALTCDLTTNKVNTTLSWTASSGAASYEVYGPSSATSCPAGTCGVPTANSLAITGLAPSTTFSGSTGANSGFTVLARNSAGYSAASTRLTVTTPACGTTNTAPIVTITTPTTATTYATSVNTVSLAGTASDNTSVASVAWRNQTTGTTGTATGTTSWTTSAISLQAGANTLVVTATDNLGLTSTDTLTVTYTATSNQAPVVTITSPTTAATYATSTNFVVLAGTASDDVSVSSVSYTNQTSGFSATSTGTTSWSTANIPLWSGSNTIVVTATDNLGLTSTDTITVSFSSLSASPWPASATGTEIGSALASGYEPSGAFWNPADQMLYFVSDGGVITRMDQNGGNVTSWSVGGNLEGITGTSAYNVATLNYLYVVDENTSSLKEFSPWNGTYTGKSWSLGSVVPTDVPNNNGIEGVTFVPNGVHPYNTSTTGGVFYVSSQSTGKVYVLNINLVTSGSTPTLLGTITPNLITTGSNDISDLYYAAATNKVFVLYDANNVVHEMRPNGLFINEYYVPSLSASGEEAITTIPTCSGTNTSIVLGYDDAGATHHLYRFSNYPQPCVDVTPPVISSVVATPTGTAMTVTWTTNETSDSVVEFGIGNYTLTSGDVALKTTGHTVGASGLPNGTYQFRVKSKDEAGNVSSYTTGNFIIGGSTVDPIVYAAGDIANANSTGMTQTSNWMLGNLTNVGAILTLGDNAYGSGTLSQFTSLYAPSWGRTALLNLTKPTPGNHEYLTASAAGYFDYFNGTGVATGRAGTRGQGWYSYNVGNWHLIALNSSDGCSGSAVSCAVGSTQETWLRNDLAANAGACTIAYDHHPRFSSGDHGDNTSVQPLWDALADNNVELFLSGHDHGYERKKRMNSAGTVVTNGVRQFVVGTGGTNDWYAVSSASNQDFRLQNTFGVLKLTLHASSYDWAFIRTSDGATMDSGTESCY